MNIILTDRAITKMKQELQKRETPDSSIRFGISGGGCSGYSYLFIYDDEEPKGSDHVFDFNGLKFIVDAKSMILVTGSRIDFETGLQGHGFKFDNPNVKSSCGCGESIVF